MYLNIFERRFSLTFKLLLVIWNNCYSLLIVKFNKDYDNKTLKIINERKKFIHHNVNLRKKYTKYLRQYHSNICDTWTKICGFLLLFHL